MKDPAERIPILSFLIRHKWRIILPPLFVFLYWGVPRYQNFSVAVSQNLFVKSDTLTQHEIRQEVTNIQNRVLGDEFLASLVSKYDLYKTEDSEQAKIVKLRKNIDLSISDEDFVGAGTTVSIWTHFREGNGERIVEVSNEIAAPFEAVQSSRVEKYLSRPYDPNRNRSYVSLFWASSLLGLVLIAIPLILIWEIPRMFYSQRTKEAVFDPLRSDWESELLDAKLSGNVLKTLVVNIRYSFAFVSTIFQRSPAGDLIEFVRRVAS